MRTMLTEGGYGIRPKIHRMRLRSHSSRRERIDRHLFTGPGAVPQWGAGHRSGGAEPQPGQPFWPDAAAIEARCRGCDATSPQRRRPVAGGPGAGRVQPADALHGLAAAQPEWASATRGLVGRHIAALVAQHTREQNRLHVAVGSQDAPRCVAQDLKRSLISLERRIVKMRPEAMALVPSDAEVGQRLLSNQVKKRGHVKDTITITMCASGRYGWPLPMLSISYRLWILWRSNHLWNTKSSRFLGTSSGTRCRRF